MGFRWAQRCTMVPGLVRKTGGVSIDDGGGALKQREACRGVKDLLHLRFIHPLPLRLRRTKPEKQAPKRR